jgi:hypothetical protein
VVWPVWDWEDVHRNNGGAAPRKDRDRRHQVRSDPVARQIRESLLHVKRLSDAANMAASRVQKRYVVVIE